MLSDNHKRETYDAIGERGMKWIEEPFSMDPSEMAHNFATSSVLDRSKIFAIFVAIAIAILIVPILVCLQVDQKFGNAPWFLTLIPLWIWNAGVFTYHIRIIMMGEIEKPDHIPDDEWIDPLPMSKRRRDFYSFFLFACFEVLAVLRIDGYIDLKWSFIFIPLLLLEISNLIVALPVARVDIITVSELEGIYGKKLDEFSDYEKSSIAGKYIVVSSRTNEDFDAALQTKSSAKQNLIKICCKVSLIALLMARLDDVVYWNWWLVFSPLVAMAILICYVQCQNLTEVQRNVSSRMVEDFEETKGDYGAMEEGKVNPQNETSKLSEEEKEKLRNQVQAATSKVCGSCCTGAFSLILVVLVIQKIRGAGFSALWIISPFLFLASVILCILGCAIFGVSPIDENGSEFERSEVQNSMEYKPPVDASLSPETVVDIAPETTVDVAPETLPELSPPPKKPDVWKDSPTVDLLDDNDPKNLHGPTRSEVDDLD